MTETPLFGVGCRLWRRWTRFAVVLAVAAGPISACGDSPVTDPGGPANAAPVIESLVLGAQQVEADLDVQLTATVKDAETAPAQLTYLWSSSSSGGSFVGTGAQVRWKAPRGATTPDLITLTLTVVEAYGTTTPKKENRTTSTVQVRYNDSEKEIRDLASQFLTDFGTYSVSPSQCVRNFSDTLCASGKASEMTDVANNRNRTGVQIESATFSQPAVTLNAARTSGNASAVCTFVDRFSNGSRQTVTGTCNISAVYDAFRWFLCTSTFDGPFVTSNGLAPSRYSHP